MRAAECREWWNSLRFERVTVTVTLAPHLQTIVHVVVVREARPDLSFCSDCFFWFSSCPAFVAVAFRSLLRQQTSDLFAFNLRGGMDLEDGSRWFAVLCFVLSSLSTTTTAVDPSATITVHCQFPVAEQLRIALADLGLRNISQCMAADLGGMLASTEQSVLFFTGGVREHCLTSMHRLNSAGDSAIPIDDEDTGIAESGDAAMGLTDVCETPLLVVGREESTLVLSVGATMKPLGDVLDWTQQTLQYLTSATAPLKDRVLRERISVLQGQHRNWKEMVKALGIIEGYQDQLNNLRGVHNVTRAAVDVCKYAFPDCLSASRAAPIITNLQHACYRWQATDMLLHPGSGHSQLKDTFYWKFMSEQCVQTLEQSHAQTQAEPVTACFTTSQQTCGGRAVSSCPGRLHKTDDQDHWVGRTYLTTLQSSSGIGSVNSSVMPPACTFPCGIRCRNHLEISDGQVETLKSLHLASFFAILAGSALAIVIALSSKTLSRKYSQRLTVYMTLIFLLWSVHYLPGAFVDVEPHLCHSDRTVRFAGHSDNIMCSFTFAMLYGMQVVFLCMTIFGGIAVWAMAHSLNPLTTISVAEGNRIILEALSLLFSLLVGGVFTGMLISKDGIIPSVTAGHCTVAKRYFRSAVLYPFGIAIAIQVLLVLMILFELLREVRRNRKMRHYTTTITIHTEKEPSRIVFHAFCFATIYLLWSGLVFWYAITLEYHGEKLPSSVSGAGLECEIATCGSASCTKESKLSPNFFPILVAFRSICILCGLVFPVSIIMSSNRRRSLPPEELPIKERYTAIATAKQLSKASMISYEFPPPPPTTLPAGQTEI